MVGELLTPLLQKKFSRDERNFYNVLANGIDSSLMYSISWLKTHEANRLLDVDDEDEFDEMFMNSELYRELNKRIRQNVDKGISVLPAFYRKGTRVAALDLRLHPEFNSRDQRALNILFDYNTEIINNVNIDTCLSIKDIIYAGGFAGLAVSKIAENILNAPNAMSKYSGATPNTRCTMIATTEYGRAINTGVLQCYVNHGVYMVDIVTAGDDRVCVDCLEIERNNPYEIEEAMNLIPVHSQCRCSIKRSNDYSLDPDLTRDWVVNMTDNDYTLQHTNSNPYDVGYSVN